MLVTTTARPSATRSAPPRTPSAETLRELTAVRIRRPLPWWSRALLAFAASRLVSTGLWLLVMALARPGSRIGQHATIWHAMAQWDGQWYELIARSGYPGHLPVGQGGLVETNAWAFLPAYPWLAELLTFGHPALWQVSAELLSTAFGFGCAVLLALLLRPQVGERGAQRAVWLFALSPVAFILQAAYAESMGLFLLLAALCLIDRHRYLGAIAPTALLAFTRPGVQALALAVLIHLVVRAVVARRARTGMTRGQLARGVVLLVAAGVAGFAWPWIAAAVTGDQDAYLRTELSWRLTYTGITPFVPGLSWIEAAWFWAGRWAPLLLAAVLGGFAALLCSGALRRCGLTVWAWSLAWGLYLLAVLFPQSSTFRLLLPMAPAGGALAAVRSRRVVLAVLGGSVALQALWLYYSFGGWQFFWSVP
ncbi:hypothetical protein QDR37_01550 [Amnibacterium sp. CER49]|uniref:hypothetical protein n=1 Tax=Amnibacterium sp. CER49 TaxID=3039161 RepID=UPI002449B970|nr:hypothetical protein [Amnibacterium sp. CER49]MDH2442620.1 hypothetical protein [Amnibacterium sp. CER49]